MAQLQISTAPASIRPEKSTRAGQSPHISEESEGQVASVHKGFLCEDLLISCYPGE